MLDNMADASMRKGGQEEWRIAEYGSDKQDTKWA